MKLSKAMRCWRIGRSNSRSRACRIASAAGSLRKDKDGVAAVELALVLPFLMMLLVGIIDFGALFFLKNNMFSVARDSARALALQSVTVTEAEQMAQDNLINWNATFDVVAQEVPNAIDPAITDVVVTITVPMADAAPIGLMLDVVGFTGTLQSRVAMRQEI